MIRDPEDPFLLPFTKGIIPPVVAVATPVSFGQNYNSSKMSKDVSEISV